MWLTAGQGRGGILAGPELSLVREQRHLRVAVAAAAARGEVCPGRTGDALAIVEELGARNLVFDLAGGIAW